MHVERAWQAAIPIATRRPKEISDCRLQVPAMGATTGVGINIPCIVGMFEYSLHLQPKVVPAAVAMGLSVLSSLKSGPPRSTSCYVARTLRRPESSCQRAYQ